MSTHDACGSTDCTAAKRSDGSDAMTYEQAGPAAWEDPRVQQIYALLCDTPEPPAGEHWEGWVARLIVSQVVDAAVDAAVAKERTLRTSLAADFAEYLYRISSQVPIERAEWAQQRGAALLAALKA